MASVTWSRADGQLYSLGNQAIETRWKVVDGHLTGLTVIDRADGKTVTTSNAFSILLGDRGVVKRRIST